MVKDQFIIALLSRVVVCINFMLNDYFSHTLRDVADTSQWERLTDHLKETAELAGRFASDFECGPVGRMMGVTHDLGKSSEEFLNYLLISGGVKKGRAGKVNHSTAGAKWLWDKCGGKQDKSGVMTPFLAYGIAGHHAGLCDGGARNSPQSGELAYRLKSTVPVWDKESAEVFLKPYWEALHQFWETSFFRKENKKYLKSCSCFTFWIRMLFSCLVDADYLCTERFMSPDRTVARKSRVYGMDELLEAFNRYLQDRMAKADPSLEINGIRRQVSDACQKAAQQEHGLFSLTVPTGGGKTLASLRFALEHAISHGKKRIIYVIPYTSIIEQTARVYKEIFASLGEDVVLEHHSNYAERREEGAEEQENETDSWNKLASENWDAPIIVTTSVQFFESLYASKTSRCRKLHNIINSVVIFDEVQMIPLSVLKPCLDVMKILASSYKASLVLCTATQPALEKREEFKEGLENICEIIPNYKDLFVKLKRVRTMWFNEGEPVDDTDLADFISNRNQALCIVDTRRQAEDLFRLLKQQCEEGSCFHLSAAMCAQHRTLTLYLVRRRLRSGKPCRLISTQLIEAGVDVDFPVVLRCLAGLDSLTQAAGRCNREGRLQQGGEFYIFRREKESTIPDILLAAQHAREVLSLCNENDLIGEKSVRLFFELHFWHLSGQMDRREVMAAFYSDFFKDPYALRFQELSQRFKFIDNETISVFVPFGKKGSLLCDKLRQTYDPKERRTTLRALQRYVVGVHENDWKKLMSNGMLEIIHDSYYLSPKVDSQFYSKETGLNLENSGLAII